MEAAKRPPVLAGVAATRAYVALVLDPIQNGRRLHDRLGPIFAIDPPLSGNGRRAVLVANEGLAAEALEDPERFRSSGLSMVRGPKDSAQCRLREGLVRMNGPLHDAYRRSYAPSLAKKRICGQAETLDNIAASEISSWPTGEVFDLRIALKRIARRAAAALLFGAGEDPEILRVAEIMERHNALQYRVAPLLFPVALPFTPYAQLLAQAARTERALIDWLAGRPRGGDNLVARIVGLKDANGRPISAAAQAGQFWTLYGASFDTTATALAWAVLHLMCNADSARRLLDELRGDGPGSPYLEAVALETLRMSPPVPYQLRRTSSDLHFGGLPLRRGDRVFISAAVMNRCTAIYAHPDRFLPERWLEMRTTPYRPLALSAGPRRCPGYSFALAVMKSSLAALWPRLRLELATKHIGVSIAISQGPKRIPVTAHAQDGRYSSAQFFGAARRQMSRMPGRAPRPMQKATTAPASAATS
jgi:cytochrome P450